MSAPIAQKCAPGGTVERKAARRTTREGTRATTTRAGWARAVFFDAKSNFAGLQSP